MPTSSSASAVSVGVNSPLLVRWLSVRDVVNPSAPASIASRAMPRHRVDVVGRRGFAARAALAHHVQPQRAVRHLHRDVDVERPAVERVHELGERLPVPRETFVQHRARDVLDALHQLDEPVVIAGRTGAKPTPQLPTTTVVTPCHDDGIMRSPHDAWPS